MPGLRSLKAGTGTLAGKTLRIDVLFHKKLLSRSRSSHTKVLLNPS